MPIRRAAVLVALLAGLPVVVARADKPTAATPAADPPLFVDDDEMFKTFSEKTQALAKAGKCLAAAAVRKKPENFGCKLDAAKPADKRLDPEDVYAAALPSVFLLGTVVKEKDEDGNDAFADGRLGTAWVLTADGVLVTNWHLFDELKDGEVFAVMNHKQDVYPVTDLLAVDRAADIALFRIAAKGLTPLPLAEKPPRVGAWVGVLGNPGDRYFTFTQGAVSRYTKSKRDDGKTERWMSVTADYAHGSSGSPVLDRTGAVVGMAALTENLDYPEEAAAPAKPDDPKKDEKKDEKPKDPPPAAKGSLLQMVVKLTVPVAEIRALIGGEK